MYASTHIMGMNHLYHVTNINLSQVLQFKIKSIPSYNELLDISITSPLGYFCFMSRFEWNIGYDDQLIHVRRISWTICSLIRLLIHFQVQNIDGEY